MKYKVIHESHARFLSDSEYRVLLSINMFQNVGKELISIELLANDCLLDDNTVKRSIQSLGERNILEWKHRIEPKNWSNLISNVYTIKDFIKKEHESWNLKTRIVDTRSFEGAPAWACWFIATLNSMRGFDDCPPKRFNFTTISEYCQLDKRTVKKYHDVLSKNKTPGRWPPVMHDYFITPELLFSKGKGVVKLVDICGIPERKKWTL